ncbi:hypothetical protein [Streptomyces sp. NBC_01233]|uniref:hypothetical protein n=1 Tax=Streptomyces sp. NBC_01233 TaxID=2903787 RepID=UPI002E14EBB5|nr:hypothetical protein OG332_24200 [Streptomyces sp. NBC_01233]
MKALAWIKGGNDRALATTRYAGQQSATEKANAKAKAKQRARQQAGVKKAARAGEAWEAEERRRTR